MYVRELYDLEVNGTIGINDLLFILKMNLQGEVGRQIHEIVQYCIMKVTFPGFNLARRRLNV